MKLGFIGTGVITEAMITGFMSSDAPIADIYVSRRGETTSARLAKAYPSVTVCDDNQEIADRVEILFLAIRPQVAREVLAELNVHDNQQVVSLIAGAPTEAVRGWLGTDAMVMRAIPLPAVTRRCGVTALYPPSDIVAELFAELGTAVSAETVEEFDTYAVASALMGTYFGVLDTAASWMTQHGAAEDRARSYLTSLFLGLARTAAAENQRDFTALQEGHSTPGGLNQQLFEVFRDKGGLRALELGFSSVHDRARDRQSPAG